MPNRLKDEDYWWDILKTVISFSITGILAYLTALSLGYVSTPTGQRVALTVALLIFSIAMCYTMLVRSKDTKDALSSRQAFVIAILISLFSVGCALLIAYLT